MQSCVHMVDNSDVSNKLSALVSSEQLAGMGQLGYLYPVLFLLRSLLKSCKPLLVVVIHVFPLFLRPVNLYFFKLSSSIERIIIFFSLLV